MKKILMMTAVLVFAATTSFAAVSSTTSNALDFDNTGLTMHADDTTADADSAVIGRASTGVSVGWMTDANGYALLTQHKNGTKAYATSYDSTAIYQSASDSDPGVADAVLTASDTTDFTDTSLWKSM